VELAETPFANPSLRAVDVAMEGDGRVVITIDYDRLDIERVSGQIALHLRTANARRVAGELRARLAPAA
jgi:hypothetical protein